MNILFPVHYFTDDPQSGFHTELWNLPLHLAKCGNRVFVVTLSALLTRETKKSLKEKNIYLYQIYDYKTHGLGYTQSLMVFFFSVFLRLFHKFDWIFVIDNAKTPFSYFKLGAKYAARVYSPETPELIKLFNSGDWVYDREHKDATEGWDKRKTPLIYRIFSFISFKIWYPMFPVKKTGENADMMFCQGMEPFKYHKSIGTPNPVYLLNGVESERFDNFKGGLIDKKDRFVYLFIGRIMKSKGIFRLIDAFKKLAERYSDIDLWVVGASYSHYDKLLRESVKGFENRIKLLGQKNRDEIVVHIKSCDVLVDPFIYAAFSNVVIEALYAKKPVIAPILGDTKDLVKEGITGFLVDSRDVSALIKKMEYCYTNYAEVERMAVKGHEFIKKYLTWDKIARIADDNFRFFGDEKKRSELNRKYENFDY